MGALCLAWCLATLAVAAEPPICSDRPNEIEFPAAKARFVRVVILGSSSGQPGIDELEVYGPAGKQNLALAEWGAKATASSCLAGYAIHRIAHLNDGLYGNDHSWIAAGTDREWVQVELAEATTVSTVVFSRDRTGQYADRVPIHFEVRLSEDGQQWETVRKVETRAAPVVVRGREADFAGRVPNAPPPPRVDSSGAVILAEASADVKVSRKDDLGLANLALSAGATASASSLLPDHPIHQIAHLNDGLAGNEHSWISRTDPSWAEIDLGGVYWIYKVALGSDTSGRYHDRAATTFSILTAAEYDRDSGASTWQPVFRRSGGPPVHVRSEFEFPPVKARWVRIAVEAANQDEVRIDEIEVYGQRDPISPEKIGPLPKPSPVHSDSDTQQLLRYALLGEEHAWLKTYGRADLSPRLVPYNGRVKEYPRHVDDDRLPLPPLAAAPLLDGSPDDRCWSGASRGVVRVAWPYDFELGPLIDYAVTAGHKDGDLYLAIRTNRLLSSHVAVVSTSDGQGCGVVSCTGKGLVLNTYDGGKLKRSASIEGRFDASLGCCEVRLPLSWFPDCRAQGIRVGLGMGGKHTKPYGRAVHFVFSPLSIAEVGPYVKGTFRVRLALAPGADAVTLRGDAPGLAGGLALAPGTSKTISIAADGGPIGPQYNLTVGRDGGGSYALHLFRYDPLGRTLTLMEEIVERFAARGLEVEEERRQLAGFHRRHAALLAAETTDAAAERQALFDARAAKRKLFFREPDLAAMGRILFVKRHAFQPSHNYSVNLDARFRPGGGVYLLEIPRRDGRFEPGEARLTELFGSVGGIARNPMADFDLGKIYFAYRRSAEGYYHLMSMDPDGSGLKQLTDGPFHDYWPCPLPDGGIAFVSTRCKARYLCWRPQAAVLFRMGADGGNMRPLSFANLSEWAPSVMRDGRILWTRSEYLDKGADFGHTLWAIRADGTKPELVFGNTIIQPNGYANGREVPGTNEICCTLISHFGDLNGPLALVDLDQGRFNPEAIQSITPEVPRPGMWPREECFRDPVPLARDYFLCSHAPRDRFGLYLIDRFGNREILYLDRTIGSMCPTPFCGLAPPPVWQHNREPAAVQGAQQQGQFVLVDVYRGIEPAVKRGTVKYLRVAEELRADLIQMPNGEYQKDHTPFQHWYATPVDKVSGPSGWPTYVAKATLGIAPVEEDGSANFRAPAGKVLYFQALDENFNELQRMRSVVQLQPGEKRSCIGCHERRTATPPVHQAMALRREPSELKPPPWGAGPLAYEKVVQPVWDAACVRCHDADDQQKIDLTAGRDADRVPASYRTLIAQGWVHYLDCGYNSGGCEKRDPLTFGTVQSRLWEVLDGGHYDVKLSQGQMRRIKCWTDLNCPLWADYVFRGDRPGPPPLGSKGR